VQKPRQQTMFVKDFLQILFSGTPIDLKYFPLAIRDGQKDNLLG
jgi:hypothetical protein